VLLAAGGTGVAVVEAWGSLGAAAGGVLLAAGGTGVAVGEEDGRAERLWARGLELGDDDGRAGWAGVREPPAAEAGGMELFDAIGSLFRGAEETIGAGSAGERGWLGAAAGGAELFDPVEGALSLDEGDGVPAPAGAACFNRPDEGVRERDGMRLGRKE
jgi:hypothetical protein